MNHDIKMFDLLSTYKTKPFGEGADVNLILILNTNTEYFINSFSSLEEDISLHNVFKTVFTNE